VRNVRLKPFLAAEKRWDGTRALYLGNWSDRADGAGLTKPKVARTGDYKRIGIVHHIFRGKDWVYPVQGVCRPRVTHTQRRFTGTEETGMDFDMSKVRE
jgi:hypothetical protein